MKTPLLVLLVGCTAPVAPAQKPAAAPVPMVDPIAMHLHETQLASWTPRMSEGPAMAVAADRPERCSVRVTAKGVSVDGEVVEIEQAIAICSQRSAVLVEVADDAEDGVWAKLERAFTAAKVLVLHRGHRADGCLSNPLSKTCP